MQGLHSARILSGDNCSSGFAGCCVATSMARSHACETQLGVTLARRAQIYSFESTGTRTPICLALCSESHLFTFVVSTVEHDPRQPVRTGTCKCKCKNLLAISKSDFHNSGERDHKPRGVTTWKPPSDNCKYLTGPPPVRSEVVTCNCVRNPGGHAESNPRPSKEGVSFYHVLRPLVHECMQQRTAKVHKEVDTGICHQSTHQTLKTMSATCTTHETPSPDTDVPNPLLNPGHVVFMSRCLLLL